MYFTRTSLLPFCVHGITAGHVRIRPHEPLPWNRSTPGFRCQTIPVGTQVLGHAQLQGPCYWLLLGMRVVGNREAERTVSGHAVRLKDCASIIRQALSGPSYKGCRRKTTVSEADHTLEYALAPGIAQGMIPKCLFRRSTAVTTVIIDVIALARADAEFQAKQDGVSTGPNRAG